MQKFEILYNRAFSASTQEPIGTASAAETTAEASLFETQQNPTFQQEYFIYLQQNGVSLVNDLNVKGYLNDPKNEAVANDFIDYMSGTCSYHEFTDILYDSKKLSDYFNDYYRKFQIYSNEGIGDSNANPSINLETTKSRVLQQDRLYVQTNALTHYYLDRLDDDGQMVARSTTTPLLPSDLSYFSGTDQSYYVNIVIDNGRKTFFSDDFSQYYQDCCDGTITYNKYNYINSISENITYGNYSTLQDIQRQFNLSVGPSKSSVDYIRGFLPVNFLFENELVKNQNSSLAVDPSTTTQLNQFISSYGYVSVPQNNSYPTGQIVNFTNFTEFQTYMGFRYQSWSPQFQDPSDYRKKYIYHQAINFADIFNQVFLATQGRDNPPATPPIVYFVEFEETPTDPSYKGQLFDQLNTNTYRIRINHTSQSQAETVILRWEPCSVGNLGADDGFNAVSFNIDGNVNPDINTITISFSAADLYQDVFINIYKNWPVRTPVVFSIRPQNSPNLVLGYLVIYLEEFYEFRNFSSSDQITVTSYDMCKLMYNCFVDKNFNDNFLEFQRPDTIPVNFVNTTGLTLQQSFDMANTARVNSKLLSVYNNQELNLASIASIARVPVSGIYNIYVWGSHLFGTQDAYSDADLIIVADGQTPVRQVKTQGVDIAVYTPQRFQFELEEVVVKMLGDTVSSDRVFTIYNSSNPDLKVLERISFMPNSSKAFIKRKANEFKTERWAAVEEAFFMKDTESWQKRLWSIFRNLIFTAQFIRDGKITDLNAPQVYLDDIVSKNFTEYSSLVKYFNPKVESLYSALLSL